MENDKKNIWFPAKKYGIGWGFPVTWQGWVVLLSYILLILIGIKNVTGSFSQVVFFLVYVAFLTALLIFICLKKGEKPAWRWGNKK